eukprot:1158872-Pelagomonas_calceolata.AAC.4
MFTDVQPPPDGKFIGVFLGGFDQLGAAGLHGFFKAAQVKGVACRQGLASQLTGIHVCMCSSSPGSADLPRGAYLPRYISLPLCAVAMLEARIYTLVHCHMPTCTVLPRGMRAAPMTEAHSQYSCLMQEWLHACLPQRYWRQFRASRLSRVPLMHVWPCICLPYNVHGFWPQQFAPHA